VGALRRAMEWSLSQGVTMIPDKRLVWHPRRDDEFVVGGGTQITLYGLAKEYPGIRQLASRNDLLHMRVSSLYDN
jgi:hypothetical protein